MNTQQPMRIIRATEYSAALEIAAANPEGYIEVFVDAWSEVDRCRAHAADHGLSGQIGIHHRSALEALIEMQILPPKEGDPNGHGPDPRRTGLASRLETFIRAAAFALASKFTIASLR